MEATSLKNIFDALPGGFLITDTTSKVVYANASVGKRSGFTVGEIVGKKPGELWGGHMKKQFYQSMWHVIKQGEPFVGMVENRKKNGNRVQETLHIAPIKDSAGHPKYFVEMHPVPEAALSDFDAAFVQHMQHWSRDTDVWQWILGVLSYESSHMNGYTFGESDLLTIVEDELIAPTETMFLRRFEDAPLIEAAKANPKAFAQLYEKYRMTVVGYFLRRLGDALLSEDLTQEVFARAFHYLPTFRVTNASYLTYLLHVAHSILVNYYRKEATSPRTFPLETVGETVGEATGFSKESLEVLLRILTPIERQVVLLTYRDGFRAKEIAETLGKTENAVKLILSRSRKKLRSL